jgi:hypothetical protein
VSGPQDDAQHGSTHLQVVRCAQRGAAGDRARLARALWRAHAEDAASPGAAGVAGETGGSTMQHPHVIGDYVVPADLPRRFVCRVTAAHAVGDTGLQMLELEPIAGPWPPGTRLIRGGESVHRASGPEVRAACEPEPLPIRRRILARRRRPAREDRARTAAEA